MKRKAISSLKVHAVFVVVGMLVGSWSGAQLAQQGSTWPVARSAGSDGSSDAGRASAGAFTLWFPVAARADGLNGAHWRTNVALLNSGPATANVEVSFLGSGGTLTSTTSLPGRATVHLRDVVGQLEGSGSAALRIVSDQPLKAIARVFTVMAADASCFPNGSMGQVFRALSPGDGLSAGQAGYLSALTESTVARTNIGLVNISQEPATAFVELYDGDGNPLASYTVSLSPGEWKQQTQPFNAFAGQTAMERGYARVTAISGAGVNAYASVIDNITNDPSTVELIAE